MPIQTTHRLMKQSFSLMWKGADYLVNGWSQIDTRGAQFARPKDYRGYLSPRNKGLLLDGDRLRLSEKTSFQNVAVYGVTGKGKSSVFVKPIILDQSFRESVIIVNDMSGDIYADTSGHMRDRGYRVIVLNPHDLQHSHRYNPFLDIHHENETVHMAQMFVEAVANSQEQVWSAGAERFVTFFLKCLRKKGMPYNNPHNLYYLFQQFGEDGSALHRFVAECSYDDPFMINEWKSLLSVHQDGLLSFIMNATTALKIFANKDVCRLTAQSDIDLSTLRKQKTIVYVITPPQYQKMYRPVTSMIFLSFLHACMRNMPDSSDLPVYFLWDEWGNSYLPDADTFATTVRKYNISLMLFMQGINQLVQTYGREKSSVILSGVATQISFGAAEQETAEYFERRVGKVRQTKHRKFMENQIAKHVEYNLFTASEIRELPDNEILILSDNRKPLRLPTTPCYKHYRFKRLMKKRPAPITSKTVDALEFVPL